MLLKSTISNTKKFFKNSLQNFKSLLSGGYQKLPKTKKAPSCNPFSYTSLEDSKMHQGLREMDSFYTDFTKRWDLSIENAKKESNKKVTITMEEDPVKNEEVMCEGSTTKFCKERSEREESSSSSRRGRYLVAQRLKELELMDSNNVDHVLDVEEALHYYSRLRCPAYVDIIDRFLMQVHKESFHSPMLDGNSNSRKSTVVRL